MEFNLLLDTSRSKLAGIENPYFSFDELEEENVEGAISRANQRNFYLNHPNSNNFINKMGIENTFYLHRLLLSYYDAFSKLKYFWENYACPEKLNLQANIEIADLEKVAKKYPINVFDTHTMKFANYMIGDKMQKEYIEANPFQEYLWAINMNEFLKSYRINPFPDVEMENKGIFNSSYIFKLAISKKEVSIALYEWANINNFNQPDFIKRISNVLELIKEDLERNKSVYQKITKGTDVRENVYLLSKRINSGKKWRSFFFGVFNAADLLGAYSRHASNKIKNIVGFNKQPDLTAEEIVKMWRDENLLPNNHQFDHLFKVWYLATSILLLNWLRLNHINS
ncbi:hypothetical protein M5J14_19505 [Lysinibacillus sp. OL1_EC]|uniref:hypothetical protein n=1 Tax=unclassified Lysinibacillus TaxID=2636778 RepID=UPI00103D72B8|nr:MULTISPECIES: hypothetical protein [unclassified Lysinibacillus]MCM0626689.1 hypothetical protein [Lysinibacillus sp. OL1_EC]TBV89145.1 hypothetical protein EW028_06915 [Lysinibacillus sp. OL1]